MRLNLEPNSDDWKVWREAMCVSGSDAAPIMGESPWTTSLQLYNRKHKLEPWPKLDGGFIIERGNRVEPILIKKYIELTGHQVSHACFVGDKHDWMKGSLDGVTFDESHFVECKLMGHKQIEKVLSDGMPEHYKLQVDHYYLVTGAKTCDFVIGDEKQIHIIPHPRDEERLTRLLEAEEAWHERLIGKKPPPFTDKDVEPVDSVERKAIVGALRATQTKIKLLQEEEKTLKQSLIDETPDKSSKGNGVTVTRYWVKGRLNTSKYMKDNKLTPPEDYRGEGKWSYRITLNKEAKK